MLLQREMNPEKAGGGGGGGCSGRAECESAVSALLAVLGFIGDEEKSL